MNFWKIVADNSRKVVHLVVVFYRNMSTHLKYLIGFLWMALLFSACTKDSDMYGKDDDCHHGNEDTRAIVLEGNASAAGTSMESLSSGDPRNDDGAGDEDGDGITDDEDDEDDDDRTAKSKRNK